MIKEEIGAINKNWAKEDKSVAKEKPKLDEEMDKALWLMHNSNVIGSYTGKGGDMNYLKTYCTFLSSKINKDLSNTIKTYNWTMICFAIFNFVIAIINIILFVKVNNLL